MFQIGNSINTGGGKRDGERLLLGIEFLLRGGDVVKLGGGGGSTTL